VNTIRTTISLPPVLNDAARKRMEALGFEGLSGYVQALIRADTRLDVFEPGPVVAALNDAPPVPPTSTPSERAADAIATDTLRNHPRDSAKYPRTPRAKRHGT